MKYIYLKNFVILKGQYKRHYSEEIENDGFLISEDMNHNPLQVGTYCYCGEIKLIHNTKIIQDLVDRGYILALSEYRDQKINEILDL